MSIIGRPCVPESIPDRTNPSFKASKNRPEQEKASRSAKFETLKSRNIRSGHGFRWTFGSTCSYIAWKGPRPDCQAHFPFYIDRLHPALKASRFTYVSQERKGSYLTFIQPPDRHFHHFEASKSDDTRTLCSLEMPINMFQSPKMVKGSAGQLLKNQLHSMPNSIQSLDQLSLISISQLSR